MAILEQWNLSFEFRFKELDDELWVQYEIFFKWRGESVFRDELLKRNPPGWAKRSQGALRANEHHEDTFLPVLKTVLDKNERGYWQPTDPDFTIGFFPDEEYPFFPPPRPSASADHVIEARLQRAEAKKKAGGKLPDDTITMVAFVDAYNWADCAPYQDQGFCLCMRPQRAHLQRFYNNLNYEWKSFKTRERLDERIAEYKRECGDE